MRFHWSIYLLIILIGCRESYQDKLAEEIANGTLSAKVTFVNPELVDENFVFGVIGGGSSSFLLDKSGKVLYEWQFDHHLGNDLKLFSDGSVLATFKSEKATFNFGGGYSGLIELIHPKSGKIWDFEYVGNDLLTHHESIFLPNGNLMTIAWERIDSLTARSKGVNTSTDIFTEKIIEVDTSTKQVVWEWRSWDHVIQDQFPDLPNYGKPIDNPSLIDINYVSRKDGDIMHANGLFYDEKNDLIFISINHYNEVWVIDHSLLPHQTRLHKGGAFGVGGDLVYRFGNGEVFGSETVIKFDRVHNPNIIPEGYSGAGNILVFNNGLKSKMSVVYELELPKFSKVSLKEYVEPKIVWYYENPDLHYGRISGAYRLKNGNTLICEGDNGFWEVTKEKELAWKYEDRSNTYWRAYPIYHDHGALEKLVLEKY